MIQMIFNHKNYVHNTSAATCGGRLSSCYDLNIFCKILDTVLQQDTVQFSHKTSVKQN